MPRFPSTLRLLAGAFLATVGLAFAGEVGAQVDEVAVLKSKLAALEAQLAQKDTQIRQLEDNNTRLEGTLASQNKAIALASGESSSGKGPNIAPSSALDWDRALKAATAARYLVPGSTLMTVMPTGSMKPVFDERAILIMEPAKYDDLKIGDIVTYTHPKYKTPVVHRITEKHGNKYWTKGDNNSRMDDVYITPENYQARVCGIIYARETGK